MGRLLSLKALRDAGLTPDWQTIYVGWREPLSEHYPWRIEPLSVEAVQQYAAECLTGDPETDYLLVRILDAGSTSQELEREEKYLRELADRSGVSEDTARRKWRYIDALKVPLEASRLSRPAETAYEEADLYWEWESTVSDFWCTWNDKNLSTTLPPWDLNQNVEDWTHLLQQWLAEERTALKASV